VLPDGEEPTPDKRERFEQFHWFFQFNAFLKSCDRGRRNKLAMGSATCQCLQIKTLLSEAIRKRDDRQTG
jgi:hypothetical protein